MSHVGLYYICAHAEQASYAMLRTPMVHDNVTTSSTEKTHEQVRGGGGRGLVVQSRHSPRKLCDNNISQQNFPTTHTAGIQTVLLVTNANKFLSYD